MPQDFRHTLHALKAERPFASWISMGLGLAGLGLWAIWAVQARLPQQVLAAEVQVMAEARALRAEFPDWQGAAPETVLVIAAGQDHLVRVLSAELHEGALDLLVDYTANPSTAAPDVAVELPSLSPLQVILSSLKGGA